MFSSDASCSDCKIELVERRWTQLLLKWINKCVSTTKVTKLNPKSLADIMAKYNRDICSNDIDRAMLCTDDVEPFIKYKYPILRLRYFSEESDYPKKLYILTTIILYHCCMSSQTGAVDEDICRELNKYEQELILKFCENLSEMEATVNNVESAIRGAFESIGISNIEDSPSDDIDVSISSDTVAHASSESTIKGSIATLPSDETELAVRYKSLKMQTLKFNSSITVLPSVMAETSTFSDLLTNFGENQTEKDIYVDSDELNVYAFENTNDREIPQSETNKMIAQELKEKKRENDPEISNHNNFEKKLVKVKGTDAFEENVQEKRGEMSQNPPATHRCLSDCACNRCSTSGPCCGDQVNNIGVCESDSSGKKELSCYSGFCMNRKMVVSAVIVAVLVLMILAVIGTLPYSSSKKDREILDFERFVEKVGPTEGQIWQCKNGYCQKAYKPVEDFFSSYSRCSLICMGPQLWPYPIGKTLFSKKIVTITMKKLEYKFKTIPSDAVHQYLAEAFKIFIKNLAKLEKSVKKLKDDTIDWTMKKINIQIDVESDPDPRLRINTEEAYDLKIETVNNQVMIKIASLSFCGVRHGLQTLSQLILPDQSTGKLITLSNVAIKDGPSYKYRGLMIDTGRNYIPVSDLMKTIDAMATVKLNTFHWRISDATSFPLLLPKLPDLFEYGAYDRSMIYTKENVKSIVNRAGFRGIRVLVEVAAPGPVGRPWSWSPDITCPTQNNNFTCDNILCLHLNMNDANFDTLQTIYEEVLDMTKVDDVFHLSDGVFSLSNCIAEEREGFLDKALDRLKLANKGFLPKLPIVWYTKRLSKDDEAKTWERLGVQLNEMNQDSNVDLTKFKVIHSSEWNLSCEMRKQRCRKYRTWQEMYSWKSWRNTEVFTIEGGEAVLWTDLVNSGNLDSHLWPRAAAVAERLWSDIVINVTATASVYVRLDTQRWRMMFHGVSVQPVWPAWCSSNPGVCLQRLQT